MRNSQWWLRVFILVVGTVTTLSMILVPWIGRRMVKKDYTESVVREGIGTVAMLVDQREDMARGEIYPPTVMVRFEGSVRPVREVSLPDFSRLTLNQQVKIIYRLGKSGHIYVENVAPLSTSDRSAFRR